MRHFLPTLILLASSTTIFGQGPGTGTATKAPPFTSSPPIEDRNLYYAFFNAQQAIFSANQATKNANPNIAGQVDQQAAATLHVTVEDLPLVTTVVQQAIQAYAQVPSLRQSYAASSKVKLTPAQETGLDDFLRLDVTAKAVFSFSQQLPVNSWSGLHGYIIGGFKTSYQAAQAKP